MAYMLLSNMFYEDQLQYEKAYRLRFSDPNAIHLDFKVNGQDAFFLQNKEVIDRLTDILRMDKAVSNLIAVLPRAAIAQFSKRCLIDEIVLTNFIEGVRSTRKEINNILNELQEKSRGKRFYGLVQKYNMLTTKEEIPLKSCQDIRSIYDELVLSEIQREAPDNVPDGTLFRKEIVNIYSPAQKVIHKGLYPEAKIVDALTQALHFLNDQSCDMLCKISIFHYLIEYIHPFYDGNGRLGRFIASYLLSQELEAVIGYRLSYTIKENIKAYYDAFTICNAPLNRGDLTPFLIMFLSIIQESVLKLKNALQEKLVLWNRYVNQINKSELAADKRGLMLYDLLIQASLFAEHGVSTDVIMQHLQISRGTLMAVLTQVPEKLLCKEKIGKANFYSLNLKALTPHNPISMADENL